MASKDILSKLKNQIKNKDLFYLIVILVAALIIRIFYLVISKGQVLWWDEAEYMSTAKHWAFGIPYNINEQRPPIFQLLAAGLLKFGFGETALKFLLVVLPSVALVWVTYLLGKEMFERKVGLIAAFGTSIVWSILFWSVRFQPDFFSVTLQMLALLFFWRFIKSNSPKLAIYTGLFSVVAFYFKISALLVPLSILIFSLYYEGWKVVFKKNYWIIAVSFIVGLIPFMVWQIVSFGNPLAFGVSYSGEFNEGRSLGWMTLDFYPYFLKSVTFVFFIAGLAMALWKIAIRTDLLYKDKTIRKDPHIFSVIVLLVISCFYIFYIKGTIEDRWVFLIIPFSFFFAGEVIVFTMNKIGERSKIFAVLIIIIYLLMFAIPQLNHTTDLINNKKSTYLPIKEASIIIRDNSEPEDKILSVSYTQATTYSEREVIPYPRMDIENFTKILYEERPRFVMASVIEPNHPSWMVQQAQNEQGFIGFLFPYFNSTIIASPQGQVVQYDLKDKVVINNAQYTLFYPRDGSFGGVVVYKIDYIE